MVDESYLAKARYWAEASCIDKETQKEVSKILSSGCEDELQERFGSELEFGTGGLRALVGAGTSRLNSYTIRRATTALCLYLKSQFPSHESLKVAISFDSRVTSKEFSELASEVLAHFGIQVYLTKELRPTPVLSFMVRHFNCHAGICITASHNPPGYNGYKVYWADGGQVVRPHDAAIISHYKNLKDYGSLAFLPFSEALKTGLIRYCDEDIDEAYRAVARKVSFRQTKNSQTKIVYTPLHGAGVMSLPHVLKDRGFDKLLLVPEQKDPDGLFPTVSSPNPEDLEAFQLAKNFADKEGAKLVLATDPDADRLGVCVKDKGSWINLSGNQIAVLLTHYILTAHQQRGDSFKNCYLVKTIVTTDLLEKIASSFSCEIFETLTGFKWIADVIAREERKGKKFLCGGEESLGFLAESYVRDKDAITTGALICELFDKCEERGESLLSYLDKIYSEYGFFCESLKTLSLSGVKGKEKITGIMSFFRGFEEKNFLSLDLLEKVDYQKQKRSDRTEDFNDRSFDSLPKSDVLSFTFSNHLKVMIRPSGTEAKIKFYFFHHSASFDGKTSSFEGRKRESLKVLNDFVESFMGYVAQI